MVLLLGATVAVRAGAWWAAGDAFAADPDGYRRLALGFLQTGVFGYDGQPVAYRPPLYPLCVAAGGWIETVPWWTLGVGHLAAGLVTVALTARLAQRALGITAGWVAGALVAIDPLLVRQSTLVMTETLATLLAAVLLALWCELPFDRRASRAIAAGLALAAAMLCRPTFAVTGLLWLLWLLWRCDTLRQRLWWLVFLGSAVGLAMAPWTLRNLWVFGRPIGLTSHGGYTLLLANNPGFYDYLDQGDRRLPWNSADFDAEQQRRYPWFNGPRQAEYDRQAYALAWQTIAARPRDFLRAAAYRLRRFWGWVPQPRSLEESAAGRWTRWGIGLWYAGVTLLACRGVWRLRSAGWSGPWPWAALMVVSFTLAHAFYWTDMRMRAPLIGVVSLLAAAGWPGSGRPNSDR